MSTIIKRSLKIACHVTSISLEQEFWDALKEIARHQQRSVPDLVAAIYRDRTGGLSSAIRVHVLQAIKAACTEQASDGPTEASSTHLRSP